MYEKHSFLKPKFSAIHSLQLMTAIFLISIYMIYSPMPVSAQGAACAVDVMLVIDISGSMSGTPQANAQAAAKNFIDQMNLTSSRVGLVSFDNLAQYYDPPGLTNNGLEVQATIDTLINRGGSTAIYNGITSATQALQGNPNPDAAPIILLLTDGVTTSPMGAAGQQLDIDAATEAKANGIRLIVIGLGLGVNTDFLQNQIASDLNDYYASPTPDQLQQIYDKIAQDICSGQICGMKYNDRNGNGSRNSNEPGLPNWEIVATNGSDTYSTNTDDNGDYCIDIPPGTYRIEETQQPPWIQTAPIATSAHLLTIQPRQTITNIDFGNRQPDITVQGHKYWDLNSNGVRDQITEISGLNIQEPLLDGFTFTLYSGDPNDPMTWSYVVGPVTVNDPNQGYIFNDIPPGDYFILEDAIAGWTQTTPVQNNGAQVFTVNSQDVLGLDFGNKLCTRCDGYIMGYKFIDSNYNGMWDSDEADLRVSGVRIELVDTFGSIIQTTITDENGLYYFQGVAPGTYTIREQVPVGWVQTAPNNNGGIHTITISPGINGIGLNFGNYRCDDIKSIIPAEAEQLKIDSSAPISAYCVIGTKFHDQNSNGVKDGGESPLENFAFKLQSTINPAEINFATSDAFGNFHFIVPQGVYMLSEISAPGWILTTPSTNNYIVTVAAGGGIVNGFEFGNVDCGSINAGDCGCDSYNMHSLQKKTDSARYTEICHENPRVISQPLGLSPDVNSKIESRIER